MYSKILKLALVLCLIAYLAVLVRLIVLKYPDAMMRAVLESWSLENMQRQAAQSNLVPFRTIASSLFASQLPVELPTLVYNVIAFMPLGLLLPCLSLRLRRWHRVFFTGLLLALGLECVQLVTMLGIADVDDVILNVTGALVGYGLLQLALRVVTPPPAG